VRSFRTFGREPPGVLTLSIAASALLVYTYLVYPVAVALLARVAPLRVKVDPGFTPMVTALIPVYNARDYVAPKLDSLLAQDYPPERLEVLVRSDGSDDGTDAVLEQYAEAHPGRIHYLRAERRSGKPSALNAMRERARGSVLLMTDIRQPLSRGCVRELVSRFADDPVGAVSGNLVLEGGTGAGLYWRYENWMRHSEGRFRSMVGVTGPIYAVRKRDMPELPEDIILDDMWVPMLLRLRGRRILFAPEAHAYDEAFGDEREFGRKVRTLAGNYQLLARLPRLLLPFANPSWFELVSHKLLRLVCPWALLALAVSCAAVLAESAGAAPSAGLRFVEALAVGQACFYALALLGPRAGRLGGLARTFVVLNFAAVAGLWRFLTGSQAVTW